ncbi:transcriptional regulator [Alloalcanivorax xenomutans]|uniref:transcriptional regulator n=1 Tax=Alloalcanivorax xenomutans TaxID=1094342 RepID=UPI0009EC9D60
MQPSDAVLNAAVIVGNKSELARLIGVKPPTVQQWINGERPVPPRRAARIEEVTHGRVSRRDLCPGFPWGKPETAA